MTDCFRDLTLTTLALAIALGWALFQVAEGIAHLVSTVLIDYPNSLEVLTGIRYSQPLSDETEIDYMRLG